MSGEEIAVVIAGISALIATTIYAMKNIRESSCSLSGCECFQDTPTPQTNVSEI